MNWKNTFTYNGQEFSYNEIKYNNPSERSVEISLGFNFLAKNNSKDKILEVGNTLSYYENSLSDYLNLNKRRVVDKFEQVIGVDQVDLMDIPSSEKYDAIVSISTLEHVGQGQTPQGIYGESESDERDREAPLKALTKIYDLLAIGGQALVTVPFGKLIDGGWYIQFSREYLDLLTSKYRVNSQDVSVGFLHKKNFSIGSSYPHQAYQEWLQVEASELDEVEYNSPFLFANAIAIIELMKQSEFEYGGSKPKPTQLEYAPAISLRVANGRIKAKQLIANQVADDKLDSKSDDRCLIAIDAVFFQFYKTGIARVWTSLLEYWSTQEFRGNIVVLDRAGTAPKFPGIKYRQIPEYNYSASEEDKGMLQAICDDEGVDIFISTYYSTTETTPSVFMAYDMIPEVLGWDLNHPMWREKHRAIQQASAYLAISQNTANDLAKFFPLIDTEKVTVALCGVGAAFQPAKLSEIDYFKTKYGITKPYFMIVGAGSGTESYKNAKLFFEAFAILPTKVGFEVVCTGPSTIDNSFRDAAFGTQLHTLKLSDEELRIAYSGAIATVYPSKYEGFGLPIVEAMACGCPVITSPNASIPEVAGDAAIYVNDSDIDGMAVALCDVQKPATRQSLISAGLIRAKQFTWQSMAEKVQTALIRATLSHLNLQDINYITFPDWTQPEEIIGEELQNILRILVTHPENERTTLIIDSSQVDEKTAGLLISGIAMNLVLEENLDLEAGLEVALTGKLSSSQWEALLSQVRGRVALPKENVGAIDVAKAGNVPRFSLDDISRLGEE